MRLFVCLCVVCLFVCLCLCVFCFILCFASVQKREIFISTKPLKFPTIFCVLLYFQGQKFAEQCESRIKLESFITGLQEMFDSNQGQKFATKSENLFGFSQWNLQESIDSRRTILYDKLKYLPAIHLDSLNFVNENLERMDSGILVKLVTLILVLFLFVCLFVCFYFCKQILYKGI